MISSARYSVLYIAFHVVITVFKQLFGVYNNSIGINPFPTTPSNLLHVGFTISRYTIMDDKSNILAVNPHSKSICAYYYSETRLLSKVVNNFFLTKELVPLKNMSTSRHSALEGDAPGG